MATRDYANRKPRNAGKSRNGGKTKAASGRRPLVLAVFVSLAVGAFGYFLWSLKDSTKPQPQTAMAESFTPVPIPKKDPHALPPKPKEEWTYQEALENKQVEVDLPKQQNTPSRPYQIQCASFRLGSQADEMRAKIAFQGLEAHVKQVQGTTGVWHKVYLGPYPHKRAAERQRHMLQRAGINGCQIWLWEG